MYRFAKRKMSLMLTVSLCSAVGIAVQLIGGVTAAYMVGEGILPETMGSTGGLLVRGIGLVVTTLCAWFMSVDQKLTAAAISAGVLCLIPALCSLLLWGLDWSEFAINLICNAGFFGVCIWLLNGIKKGSGMIKIKKHYC